MAVVGVCSEETHCGKTTHFMVRRKERKCLEYHCLLWEHTPPKTWRSHCILFSVRFEHLPTMPSWGPRPLGKGGLKRQIEQGSAAAALSTAYLHLLPAPALWVLDTNCLVNTFGHKRFSFLRREKWQRSWRPVFPALSKANYQFLSRSQKKERIKTGLISVQRLSLYSYWLVSFSAPTRCLHHPVLPSVCLTFLTNTPAKYIF